MKLCKDCAHFNDPVFCHAPENGISLVDGKPAVRFAAPQRRADECGPEALWFKPKSVHRKWMSWIFQGEA